LVILFYTFQVLKRNICWTFGLLGGSVKDSVSRDASHTPLVPDDDIPTSVSQTAELFLEFMPLFYRVFGQAMEEARQQEKKYTKNQGLALMMLTHRGAMLPSFLGSCLNMQKGSLTSLVDTLEDQGFVTRVPDEKDRRKTWVQITELGVRQGNQHRSLLKHVIEQKLVELSPQEQESICSNMQAVTDILQGLGGTFDFEAFEGSEE